MIGKAPSGLALAVALALGGPAGAGGIPADALLARLQPQGLLNDFAGILKPDERAALDAVLRGLEGKTGAQLAIVTLESLEGGQIDDFAEKLFKRWGIGQKGKDNGVLLLVALGDRKARIEVGYGLEPVLPDALAGRVLDEELFPAFGAGRHAAGLLAAARRLAEIIERAEPAGAARGPQGLPGTLFLIVFLALFVGLGFFMAGAGLGAKAGFLVLWGSFFGGIPLSMAAGAAAIGGSVAPLCVLGPFALAMGLFGLSKGRAHPRKFRSGARSSRATGWVWGASGGWSSWGSGSSRGWGGGGFSSGGGGGFGGGSSGGGGASGGW